MKLLVLFLIASQILASSSKVKLGNERLETDYFSLIKDKKLGLIVNHSSVLPNGDHLIDHLSKIKSLKVVAAFGPEHGIRGEAPAGEKIDHTIDEKTGIPLYSLYGKINKPTPEMLKGIDVLIYDIQDVGARFYTYISTLYFCLEAAAENDIDFIVCDRPNPIGGLTVDGPILKENQKSFVGIAALPVQHGMTIGELALYYNDLIESKIGKKANLKVIEMENWKREMKFDETGLSWINPSPNINSLDAAFVYPGTCFLEATNISEGRGTYSPFLTIGAPFIDSDDLIEELQKFNFKSLKFSAVEFTPVDIKGMVTNPKYKNEKCNGIKIEIIDHKSLEPVKFGMALLCTLQKFYPEQFKINVQRMNRLIGDEVVTQMILDGNNYDSIINYYESELNEFKQLRTKYLLYN